MKRILFAPDAPAGLPAAPAAPAPTKPTPPPAAAPPVAAPAAPEPSDDPFTPPPKPMPPAASPAVKPAGDKGAPATVDFDTLAPKELRARVKQLNAENQQFNGTIKTLEAKIKELDSRGVDTSALTTQLQNERKEKEAIQAELRAAKQEVDPAFIEKYQSPIDEAAEEARYEISRFTVADAAGNSRPADWIKDFAKGIYGMDRPEAKEKAKELFGEDWDNVMRHYDNLQRLQRQKDNALKKEREQFKERSAKEIAEQAVKRGAVKDMWLDTNKRLAETVEDYKVDSTDTEAADARKHALSVFDAQINAADQDDFVRQKVLKDAHVRQRVGAYAVQKVQIARLKAEKEALQKQVDDLKGTAPGSVKRPGGDAPAGEENDEDWNAGLVKAARG
jgi:hypothetical protein